MERDKSNIPLIRTLPYILQPWSQVVMFPLVVMLSARRGMFREALNR